LPRDGSPSTGCGTGYLSPWMLSTSSFHRSAVTSNMRGRPRGMMKRQTEHVEALDALLREDARRQRLGDDPHCALCRRGPTSYGDCTAPFQRRGTTICCYECRAEQDGRPPIEYHHPLGRELSPAAVPLPGNVHRCESERMRDWPADPSLL